MLSRLHIEHGYPDPLLGCLRLQRVVKGIKRCKGGSQDKRLPITPDILSEIYRCLDFVVYDDVLFWASCCLVYFGFLRSSEFTVLSGIFWFLAIIRVYCTSWHFLFSIASFIASRCCL